jgi:outer membrane protein assembly factor BamB
MKHNHMLKRILVLLMVTLLSVSYLTNSKGAPLNNYWHGYKGDSGHTGFVDQKMDKKLALQWRYFFRGDYVNPLQIFGDNLYFLDRSGFLYSLQKKDATENYKIPISENRMVFGIDINESYIFVTTGPVFSRRGITDMSCYLTALKRESGEKMWSVKYDSFVCSPPVVWGSVVYCAIGKIDPTFSKTAGGNIYGYDSDTGKETLSFEIEEYAFLGDYVTVSENVIIAQANKFDRKTRTQVPPKLYALNATTGTQMWNEEPSEENRGFGMPASRGSFVYLMENSGGGGRGGGGGGGGRRTPEAWLLKIDLKTGKILKNMNIQNENFGNFSPTLAQDAIYINSFTGKIFCIDYEMEKIYWTKSYDRFSYFTELTATRNYLYTCLYSGEFMVISKEDGSVVYRYRVGNYGGIPVVSGDEVYVSGESLYCFSLNAVPMLLLEPSSLDLEKVKQGQVVQKSFRVLYTGIEKLSGKLSSSVPWLSVKPGTINGNIQTCFATIDTTQMEKGKQEGSILVETNFGTKSIPVRIEVIVPPPLPLSWNIKEGHITNQKNFLVLGQSDPLTRILLNSYELFADDIGRFGQVILLKEGANQLKVEAKSKDGRSSILEGMITLDTIPPALEVKMEKDPEYTLIVTLKGQTEPGIILRVGEEEFRATEDGSFAFSYTLSLDQTEITVIAEDSAGNQNSVTLSVEE